MVKAPMQIAVIADPHFHDIHRHPAGDGFGPGAFRTFKDTVASTRVFNESDNAFRAALDDMLARGVEIVVVVGDLTDDGQRATTANVQRMLDSYRARGLRLFSTPGNHDLYAIHGRHQSKRFLEPDGGNVLVTSDPACEAGGSRARVVTPAMYCPGYEEGLPAFRDLGFVRPAGCLHWETPFGESDDLASRTFGIRSQDGGTPRRMIDASYLCEPADGLWLLSIDANVFEPKDGATDPWPEASYFDSTDAGWNAMLRHKRFVLDWVGEVSRRAAKAGKHLLVFSHYPMIDPLSGTLDDEKAIFGVTGFARRAPRPAVADAGIAAGLKVHFSGHLHVNTTHRVASSDGFLVNVAVPSPVAFPAAYKLVSFLPGALSVETVPIDRVRGFDAAFGRYRAELARAGEDPDVLRGVAGHAGFLELHMRQMVTERYLPREWPEDLARLVPRLTLADLNALAAVDEPLDAGAILESHAGRPAGACFMDLVVDWYRLRNGRDLALPGMAAGRLKAYRILAGNYARGTWPAVSVQGRLAAFLRMFMVYADGLPSDDFTIDLATGAIERVQRARTERLQMGSASR
jgi:3',5'-cyclic AMP phosphodiesterase CpdA